MIFLLPFPVPGPPGPQGPPGSVSPLEVGVLVFQLFIALYSLMVVTKHNKKIERVSSENLSLQASEAMIRVRDDNMAIGELVIEVCEKSNSWTINGTKPQMLDSARDEIEAIFPLIERFRDKIKGIKDSERVNANAQALSTQLQNYLDADNHESRVIACSDVRRRSEHLRESWTKISEARLLQLNPSTRNPKQQ